jgi:hypothetical protein
MTLGHDFQRLRRRQHRAIAAPRVVGMAMRDQCAINRPRRVDIEIAGRAVDALVGGAEELGEAHRRHINGNAGRAEAL